MGLTLQELELLNTASAYNGEQHKAICGKAALELIEYKKIEEDLGIDSITLFEALKNGVYMLTKNFGVVYCKCPKIVHYKNGWKILIYGSTLSLTTFGKNWALTKEGLL